MASTLLSIVLPWTTKALPNGVFSTVYCSPLDYKSPSKWRLLYFLLFSLDYKSPFKWRLLYFLLLSLGLQKPFQMASTLLSIALPWTTKALPNGVYSTFYCSPLDYKSPSKWRLLYFLLFFLGLQKPFQMASSLLFIALPWTIKALPNGVYSTFYCSPWTTKVLSNVVYSTFYCSPLDYKSPSKWRLLYFLLLSLGLQKSFQMASTLLSIALPWSTKALPNGFLLDYKSPFKRRLLYFLLLSLGLQKSFQMASTLLSIALPWSTKALPNGVYSTFYCSLFDYKSPSKWHLLFFLLFSFRLQKLFHKASTRLSIALPWTTKALPNGVYSTFYCSSLEYKSSSKWRLLLLPIVLLGLQKLFQMTSSLLSIVLLGLQKPFQMASTLLSIVLP